MNAISVSGLTKKFPCSSGYRDLLPFRKREWVTAVENVSLDIEEGELFGLLGPNGAGKTTLIKMLCCLVLPNSGTAKIFEHDIKKDEQGVKKLVGLVNVEERSFFWRLTARENLRFFASLYHLSRKKAEKRIDELLELVDLSKEGNIRFQNFSTGMRQKLSIARGLLNEPKVIFVDEPTRSLDPVSAQTVRDFLKERVAGEGKTVILATHNLNEAEQLCGRLAIMNHGHVNALGSVQELRSIFQTHDRCKLQVRNISDSVLSKLRLIDDIHECKIIDASENLSGLELEITNRLTVMPQIINSIVQSGVEICDCQIKELPIDEIFSLALNRGDLRKNY